MGDEIRLTVPADPRMMLVVRMALAGFCCQCGADVDTLDDIRTLSDEACYCLMHQSRAVTALTVTARQRDAGTRIRFEAALDPASARQVSSREAETEIARCILDTLASDVRIAQDEGDMVAIEIDVHLDPL